MSNFKPITVRVNLGTARDVAAFAAYAIAKGIKPTDAEENALRRFASAVAGPVSGNLLGNVLDLRDATALRDAIPFVNEERAK